jgi:hypothetical protein
LVAGWLVLMERKGNWNHKPVGCCGLACSLHRRSGSGSVIQTRGDDWAGQHERAADRCGARTCHQTRPAAAGAQPTGLVSPGSGSGDPRTCTRGPRPRPTRQGRPAGHWVASDRQSTIHHSSAHRAASRRAIPQRLWAG